jgi:hypothetical protein
MPSRSIAHPFWLCGLASSLNAWVMITGLRFLLEKRSPLTDSVITVQKSNQEVWEVGRDANLPVKNGPLAVGAKVTVVYKMVRVSAEVKR